VVNTGDHPGAVVEYRLALSIKGDSQLHNNLPERPVNSMKKAKPPRSMLLPTKSRNSTPERFNEKLTEFAAT
jgi:hypothetical protein